MTHIAIDIDGTITGERNRNVFAQVCNETWQLGIEDERLMMLDYHRLFAQPELVTYRQKVGEASFQYELGWINLDPRVLVSLDPAPGAAESIKRLEVMGSVAYYTARYVAQLPEKSQAMAEATKQWLHEQGFPQAASVIFCESPKEKLALLAHQLTTEAQAIVMIDDRYPKLLEVIAAFDQARQAILRRFLTLVAFGAETPPEECHGVRVIPFASWRHIDTLMDCCFVVPSEHRR
ncbi:MAG: hypothetical protein ABI413_15570 [Ktedonobacteraceae bacterium]